MTSSEKRERQKEGRRSRLEAAREAEAQAARRRRLVQVAVAAAVVVALAVAAVVLLGGDGDEEGEDAGAAPTTEAAEEPTTTSVPAVTTPCPPAEGSPERVEQFEGPMDTCIEPGEPLEAEVVTSEGTFVIALDTEGAPVTANNFVALARYRYFDGLTFHRLIPGFVAQTGSSGIPDLGSGGPGYDGADVEKPTDGYQAGDVAMARAREVSGSQLFVVVGDGGDQLTNDYPRFGSVTSGLDVVTAIAEAGDPATNGTPTREITIETVTIRTPAG